MAQEHALKLENALLKSLNEIDKLYTRKIQGDMHRCAARCCDRTADPIEKVYTCIKLCSDDFEKVQQFLQVEYGQFQSRVQRCVYQCRDDTFDKAGLSPSTSEIAKLNQEYESCVISCTNKFIDMIPPFVNRMKELLNKKAYHTIPTEDDPKSFRPPTPL